MEELKDVVLNVYSLASMAEESSPSSSSSSSTSRHAFLTRLLPAVGMGAYHTELVLDGYHYAFVANAGVVKTSAARIPPQASFQEAIPLGSCRPQRGAINALVKRLGELYFTPTSYHLVHRNCNHFTETMATALILYDDLVERGGQKPPKRLKTYPDWVNRLASAGRRVVGHDDDIVPCDVWGEAARAVGADERVGWNLESKGRDSQKSAKKQASRSQKKELSDKQKAILSKIRKK